MRTATQRLLNVWIACCAILLNAFAPAASHAFAMAHGQQHTWEICLNDGTRITGTGELDRATFVALTDRSRTTPPAAQPTAPRGAMAMDDCGFCLAHGGVPGLPAATMPAVPKDEPHAQRPPLFLAAPRPLPAWATFQPRGPPAAT